MAYKTCVVLADRNPKKVRGMLAKSLRNSDYAEIRFDFMKPYDIPPAVLSIKKYLDRCICTVRSKDEGGNYRSDETSRTSMLEFISGCRPHMLDIEYETLAGDSNFRRHIDSSGASILVSWHDLKGTPSIQTLRNKMKKMYEFSKNVKIVTTAKSVFDSIKVLSLYRYAPEEEVNLIAFAMGDYGGMSRISCMQMGSPYTYVSWGRPIAPGQFSLAEIRPILKVLKETDA